MDYAEAWLLEAVVEMRVPLFFLVDPSIEIQFNRDGHGLGRESLKALLWSLFRRVDLLGYSPERDEFQPTLAELDAALVVTPFAERGADDERLFCYQLTHRGGARWEAHTRPDWAKYITCWQSWPEDDAIMEVTIAASARKSLDRFLDGLGELRDVIVPGSISTVRLAPWEEIYWKPLPEGHVLTFRCRDADWDTPTNDPGWLQARGPYGLESLYAGR